MWINLKKNNEWYTLVEVENEEQAVREMEAFGCDSYEETNREALTPERVAELNLDELRSRRNQKLCDTDWTQLTDSPLSETKKQEFATYRQALRDITKELSITPEFDINNFDWPQIPSTYEEPVQGG